MASLCEFSCALCTINGRLELSVTGNGLSKNQVLSLISEVLEKFSALRPESEFPLRKELTTLASNGRQAVSNGVEHNGIGTPNPPIGVDVRGTNSKEDGPVVIAKVQQSQPASSHNLVDKRDQEARNLKKAQDLNRVVNAKHLAEVKSTPGAGQVEQVKSPQKWVKAESSAPKSADKKSEVPEPNERKAKKGKEKISPVQKQEPANDPSDDDDAKSVSSIKSGGSPLSYHDAMIEVGKMHELPFAVDYRVEEDGIRSGYVIVRDPAADTPDYFIYDKKDGNSWTNSCMSASAYDLPGIRRLANNWPKIKP